MAQSAEGAFSSSRRNVFGTTLPELHLLVAWLASFTGLLCWLHPKMSDLDVCNFVAVHVLCLPVIFPLTSPRFVSCLGSTLCGMVGGMQLIDLCFDLCVVRGGPVAAEGNALFARRVAYFYYHAVLNSPQVNAGLLCIILLSFLGSLVGLGRGSPCIRGRFLMLGLLNAIGTGFYLTCVMPKYLHIREAAAFDPALFDGWEAVLSARIVMYVSILASLPYHYSIQLTDSEGNKGTASSCAKVHAQ